MCELCENRISGTLYLGGQINICLDIGVANAIPYWGAHILYLPNLAANLGEIWYEKLFRICECHEYWLWAGNTTLMWVHKIKFTCVQENHAMFEVKAILEKPVYYTEVYTMCILDLRCWQTLT